MLKEFKEFALKGNAVELAVGIVIGAAFNQVINSFVADIILPPFGLFTGRINFVNLKLHLYGDTFMTYGIFLNNLINFVIVAFAIFFIIKQINRFRKQGPSPVKICPYCHTDIAVQATRCPACTSQLS